MQAATPCPPPQTSQPSAWLHLGFLIELLLQLLHFPGQVSVQGLGTRLVLCRCLERPPPGSFRGVGVLQPPGPPLGPQPPPAGSCPRHIGMQPQESGGPRAGLGTGLPREQGAAQGRSQLTASSCIFSSSRAVFLLREISLSALLWVSERGEEFVDREDGAGGLQSQGHPQRSPRILSINWLRQHPAPKPPPSIPAAATGTLETGHGAMGALGRALGAHPSFRML